MAGVRAAISRQGELWIDARAALVACWPLLNTQCQTQNINCLHPCHPHAPMLVASTILRTPAGGRTNTRRCSAGATIECRGSSWYLGSGVVWWGGSSVGLIPSNSD